MESFSKNKIQSIPFSFFSKNLFGSRKNLAEAVLNYEISTQQSFPDKKNELHKFCQEKLKFSAFTKDREKKKKMRENDPV